MGFLDKLKDFINGDKASEETIDTNEESAVESDQIIEEEQLEDCEVVKIKSKPKIQSKQEDNYSEKVTEKASNKEELRELSEKLIADLLANLDFEENVTIQTLRFHLKKARNDVYSVRAEKLFTEKDFLNAIKAKIEKRNFNYSKTLNVELVFSSPNFNDYTLITQMVSLEILGINEVNPHLKARLTAKTGKTVKEEYVLTPDNKRPYLIGRGETARLDSGIVIVNDIAFMNTGDDENDKEVVRNKFVSRSILLISHNNKINRYEIGRTEFMFNTQHVVKIHRIENNGTLKEINLNNTRLRVVLEDKDMIIINREVNILFELIKEED